MDSQSKSKDEKRKIVILGGGIAGLSVAFHLQQEKLENYILFEKSDRVGGLCKSETTPDGFTFDYASHIMFTKNSYIKALYEKLLGENILTRKRDAWIYSKGVHTRYPFQANTYGLPIGVVKECLLGLIKAKYQNNEFINPKNFEEWIYANFGEGIAKHFMIPYNKKQWGIEIKKMSYAWIENRVLTPTLEEVIEGALTDQKRSFGPNATYRYPKQGGIEALSKGFLKYSNKNRIRCDSKVVKINWKTKKISLENNWGIEYRKIVYTLPLTLLDKLMTPALPKGIKEAIGRLEYNVLYSLNFAVERAHLTDKTRIYFSEQDFLMHRVGFPLNSSPNMAPKGWSSLHVEISESKYKPIPKGKELINRVICDLKKARIINLRDNIELKSVLLLDPAYLIYTQTHKKDVGLIHAFLQDNDIYPCGRFGDWEYYNMDHSILSGKRVVEQLC